MISSFFVEFTADDRIKIEPRFKGNTLSKLRIKYQTAIKTDKVNYTVVGFEPFFEYEWLTVVKYDNFKGEALKDLMKPTPVTFSPLGIHVKENWGRIDSMQLLNKAMQELKTSWTDLRVKYDNALPAIDKDREYIADHNLVKIQELINFILSGTPEAMKSLDSLYEDQTLIYMPRPEEDDFLLEENSVGANRIDRRALRGNPDEIKLGNFKIITYQNPAERGVPAPNDSRD